MEMRVFAFCRRGARENRGGNFRGGAFPLRLFLFAVRIWGKQDKRTVPRAQKQPWRHDEHDGRRRTKEAERERERARKKKKRTKLLLSSFASRKRMRESEEGRKKNGKSKPKKLFFFSRCSVDVFFVTFFFRIQETRRSYCL